MKKCREKVDLVIQKLTTKVLELKLHLSKGSYSRKWELGKIDGIEYAISILEEIKNQ